MDTFNFARALVIALGPVAVGCAVGTADDADVAGLTNAPASETQAPDPKTPTKAASTGQPEFPQNPPAPPECGSANACTGATNLGTMSGDKDIGSKTASGTQSQWFKLRLSEDEHGIGGHAMKVRAVLESAPGTNFDVFVYVPADDVVTCSGVSASSTSTGTSDTASHRWGEDGLGNDSPDDRTVTVEVRHVSGTCGASASWTLNVYGY